MEGKKKNVEGWKIGNCCVEFKITRENMKEIKSSREKLRKIKKELKVCITMAKEVASNFDVADAELGRCLYSAVLSCIIPAW